MVRNEFQYLMINVLYCQENQKLVLKKTLNVLDKEYSAIIWFHFWKKSSIHFTCKRWFITKNKLINISTWQYVLDFIFTLWHVYVNDSVDNLIGDSFTNICIFTKHWQRTNTHQRVTNYWYYYIFIITIQFCNTIKVI